MSAAVSYVWTARATGNMASRSHLRSRLVVRCRRMKSWRVDNGGRGGPQPQVRLSADRRSRLRSECWFHVAKESISALRLTQQIKTRPSPSHDPALLIHTASQPFNMSGQPKEDYLDKGAALLFCASQMRTPQQLTSSQPSTPSKRKSAGPLATTSIRPNTATRTRSSPTSCAASLRRRPARRQACSGQRQAFH